MNKYIRLLILTILIIFFEPPLFKENYFFLANKFDLIYKVLKLLGCCFCFGYYFYVKKKPSKFIKLTILLEIVGFISTVINAGSVIRFIGPALTVITMAMIGEILIYKNSLLWILKKINIYFFVCYIINIISIIFTDFLSLNIFGGIYFLGIDNRFIFMLLPWIISEGIVSICESKKYNKKFIVCFILAELVLVFKMSLGALVSMAIFLVPLFSNFDFSKYKKVLLFSFVIINCALVIFNIQILFSKVLTLAGKDSTLSGRTYIWNAALEVVKKKPLLGGGTQSEEFDKDYFFNSTGVYKLEFCRVNHAHNYLLNLAYRGGLSSVVIYLIILNIFLSNLKNMRNKKLANFLFTSIVVIMVASLFDTLDFSGLFFTYSICYNIYNSKLDEV